MDKGDTSILWAAVVSSLRCTKWGGRGGGETHTERKRNGGGGNYREFKDKHAGTLIQGGSNITGNDCV